MIAVYPVATALERRQGWMRNIERLVVGVVLLLVGATGWTDSWQCTQLRDVLIGPPYYIDQEETDLAFAIEVGSSEIKVVSDDSPVFVCGTENCRLPLSAKDFLIKGENSGSTFMLSAVGSDLGFRATYSVTSKPSVGETMIQMGVCSPSTER